MTDKTVERWDWDDASDEIQPSELGPYVLYEDHAHRVADARRDARKDAQNIITGLMTPPRDGSETEEELAYNEGLYDAIHALDDADPEGAGRD